MTKPPQQTIGNTVYTVGQEIFCNSEEKYKELQALSEQGVTLNQIAGGFTGMVFQITALPNPDPVADEWRGVYIGEFIKRDLFGPEWPTQPPAFEALQLAMQEVCKADEVKLEWPEWSAEYNSKNYGALVEISRRKEWRSYWTRDHQQMMMTCFLLGGTVSVKGGV